MTTIYFVRHAEPDLKNRDDALRPLTTKGRADSMRLSEFFGNMGVDYVYSSPLRRAVETVKPLAERFEKPIYLERDFSERKIADEWIDNYDEFLEHQWSDFLYKKKSGECLQTVQDRNIAATNMLLLKHRDKKVVVGSHENSLGTIINYYTKKFGFAELTKVKNLRPWIVEFKFNGVECVDVCDYCLDS